MNERSESEKVGGAHWIQNYKITWWPLSPWLHLQVGVGVKFMSGTNRTGDRRWPGGSPGSSHDWTSGGVKPAVRTSPSHVPGACASESDGTEVGQADSMAAFPSRSRSCSADRQTYVAIYMLQSQQLQLQMQAHHPHPDPSCNSCARRRAVPTMSPAPDETKPNPPPPPLSHSLASVLLPCLDWSRSGMLPCSFLSWTWLVLSHAQILARRTVVSLSPFAAGVVPGASPPVVVRRSSSVDHPGWDMQATHLCSSVLTVLRVTTTSVPVRAVVRRDTVCRLDRNIVYHCRLGTTRLHV
jgi:hypothetical protein